MGDNKRWFKVWTTILMDQHFLDMDMASRGIWITLGAHLAHNGVDGKMTMNASRLAEQLQTQPDQLIPLLKRLPNIDITDTCNGSVTVTFRNWHKYQVDNSLERVREYRQRQATPEPEPKKERRRFIKPTLEEVRAYCEERHNGIDAQEWIDHHERNGWKVGTNKTPMVDWKATVRTWENLRKQKSREAAAAVPKRKWEE